MMKKIKIGVLGVFRGKDMVEWCARNPQEAEVVAICDFDEKNLQRCRAYLQDQKYQTCLYRDFESFIDHDMDAVVLANYANEHAPFAIRCLEKGKNVFSEVLPVQSPSEAVQLVEAVEKSGKLYVYGENYCYFPAILEMKRLYRTGVLGEFEYGEGEYIHNCEEIWPGLTHGNPEHWRNNTSAFFYCTHSAGPLLHVTGLRPVKVAGFELPSNDRLHNMGCKGGGAGIEMVTLENGAVIKSIHSGVLKRNSTWFCFYGSKGRAETQREFAGSRLTEKLYLMNDTKANPQGEWAEYFPVYGEKTAAGRFGAEGENTYKIVEADEKNDTRSSFGHQGSDYYTMENFIRAIRGQESDVIDVYEAIDMAFVGMFAYFSVLEGCGSIEIPNFRNPEERERYRFDNRCTDPKVAGDQLVPSYSKGNPEC